nr:hypothetical protein [Tanacetum cinerariifolium]
MVAILEKTEHNTDFHQIVDFLEASHIMVKAQQTQLSPITHSHLRNKIHLNMILHLHHIQLQLLNQFLKLPLKLSRDDRQGEAFLTVSSLVAGQDRENIAKTSAFPYDSSPKVTSLDVDEGSMQQRIHELMELCTSLQRQQSQMAAKIKDQDQEISELKVRVKFLKDKERRSVEPTQEDALITKEIMEIGEELGADKSTELGSNDTEDIVNVLSSMEATNILISRGTAASVSPVDVFSTAGVPTVSGSFPTISVIFTTANVVTPYTRRPRGITIGSSQPMRSPIIGAKDKGKEKVVESEVPKKRKLQEQIDAQVAREMEEEFARENQRLSKQFARDFEIARLHAEEELKIMIEGLDKNNEVIAKHLREYEQAAADLSVGEKLELISELVKYQDHRTKILKYQAQQSKPLSKKEKKEFYMSILRSHNGWKTKHFRGMTLEQIKEKCIPVWKQYEDFIPMSSKEESERVKRQGLKIDQWSAKSMKTSEDVSEEELKGMMQLVPLEEVYVEALQQLDMEDLHQLWTLVKETLSIKQATKDKEKELWVELKRLFEPDFEDQLWTHNQAFMHDPLDWKLYDTCGVHHVSTKDQEIFMLIQLLETITPTATIPDDKYQFIEVGAQLELYWSILQDHTQLPPTLFAEIDRDMRELYTRSRAVRDEIFSQRYQFRSLEHEQERTVVTFGALWRPVLALWAWAGRVDTQKTDMSWKGYDDRRLVHDMLLQQTALQRKLQEMRGRVTALEQERDRRER